MNFAVAVITPSLNQGRFIERTIQSVLNQNIKNIEYHIIDGGSQDETLDILKQYTHQLVWTSEPDQGQANAINKGLKKISAEIIGWLNSDDIYYPNTITQVVDFFGKHPDVDVLYGDAFFIDEMDHHLGQYPTETWNIKRFLKTCYVAQPAVFFRRKLLTQFGFLNEKLNYCMDYELWLRLALQGVKFAYLPNILAGSRSYPETKTSRAPFDFSVETMRMINDKLGYVPSPWLVNHAMLKVKSESYLRFPSIKFGLAVLLTTIKLLIQWNGFIRGLMASIFLPKTLIEMLVHKRKISKKKRSFLDKKWSLIT
jgi:glycosyltransferase involved in cell wall biosynthesis